MNPLYGKTIYSDGNPKARAQEKAWISTNPTNAAYMKKIYDVSQGIWIGGSADPTFTVRRHCQLAANSNSAPVFVTYNIPYRDCGGFSAGGAPSALAYRQWIIKFAQAIGTNDAVVVVEPDALAHIWRGGCLPEEGRDERIELVRFAVETFKTSSNAKVYIDIGHARWISAPADAAALLRAAGIEIADGFCLNVSNFVGTDENIRYGTNISRLIGDKHFIIDTSRNGNGHWETNEKDPWCNPPGRALGTPTTTMTDHHLIDAFIWIKRPGESDGTCRGGPSAGSWFAEYALGLAQRAQF